MRKFSSYGPVDLKTEYYVPRTELIDRGVLQLIGEFPQTGSNYMTVWGSRQCGESWVMQQVLRRLSSEVQYQQFATFKINLEHFKMTQDVARIAQFIAKTIQEALKLPKTGITRLDDLYEVFRKGALPKPLILILDEFDALPPDAISGLASVFRNIYNSRRDDPQIHSEEKKYWLHGVALIGVRSVLGIENETGSPFNVQRSLHIPNLTMDEVRSMYQWYERESGQTFEAGVIERIYAEFQGQPGLTSWMGELISETYNEHRPTITMRDFEIAYAAAINAVPNINIVNLISKAKQEPHKTLVLELFQTTQKIPFRYDEPRINFLYMNGVIEQEVVNQVEYYVKFPSPFIQKRLFNYFSGELISTGDNLYPPLADLSDTITETSLNVKNLLRLYERWLRENRDWLLKDAPRRSDLRVFEAVYHFALYLYLARFMQGFEGRVYPEFPTGNGQIDLIITYAGQRYGLELKTFINRPAYQRALGQAAKYAKKMNLSEITLVLFIESIDDTNRTLLEKRHTDATTGCDVIPVFVATS